MATTLNVLISDFASEKTDLIDKIADGEEAKAELLEVEDTLETLTEIQALRDAALAKASAQLGGAQSGVAPLQASSTYTGTSSAINTLLTAEELVEADMTGVVGATLPMTGTYAGYVTALGTAQGTVATKIAAAAEKRIALSGKRAVIDVRLEALATYVARIEARFTSAKDLLTFASAQAQAQNLAAAWWAFHHVKAELAAVTAASSTTLTTAVSTACDDYATAYDEWVTASDELVAAQAALTVAETNLAQADGQVLTALVALVAAP
jgi:hypothetical protein